jgi:hypothetical protein
MILSSMHKSVSLVRRESSLESKILLCCQLEVSLSLYAESYLTKSSHLSIKLSLAVGREIVGATVTDRAMLGTLQNHSSSSLRNIM